MHFLFPVDFIRCSVLTGDRAETVSTRLSSLNLWPKRLSFNAWKQIMIARRRTQPMRYITFWVGWSVNVFYNRLPSYVIVTCRWTKEKAWKVLRTERWNWKWYVTGITSQWVDRRRGLRFSGVRDYNTHHYNLIIIWNIFYIKGKFYPTSHEGP